MYRSSGRRFVPDGRRPSAILKRPLQFHVQRTLQLEFAMRSKLFVTTLAACVTLMGASAPAFADIRILASPGGEVGSFVRLFATLRETGERIVIDGPCLSA